MIQYINNNQNISELFINTNITQENIKNKSALIKINLARPPEINHPRSDTVLLKKVIEYFLEKEIHLSICESADGYLKENLKTIGLLDFFINHNVNIIEIDNTDTIEIKIKSQSIFIPKLFKEFDYRISLPCASKRKDMLFSNNIKNFVGATPRKYYLNPDGKERWRAKLHDFLTDSVCNVFNAMELESKFHYYINGGNAYSETNGLFNLKEYYISDNAIELDEYIYNTYFTDVEKPEYLKILKREN